MTPTEILPVTPTDVFTSTEEVVEPAPPIFDSLLPSPSAVATGSGLLLTVRGGEEAVKPGDAVALTVTVANTGDEPARAVVIEATLPDVLHFTDRRAGWEYDRQAGWLSARVGDLEPGAQVTLDLELKARGPLDTLVEMTFEARIDGETLSAGVEPGGATATVVATVWVAQPNRASVERGGGRVASADGRVRVDFSPGALKETREITVWAAQRDTVVTADRPGRAMRFSFGPDMVFEKPVTVTVDLHGLVSLKDLPAGWQPYLIYLQDPAQGHWEYLPLKHIDWEADTITAELAHFSSYEAGVVSTNGWQLLFKDAVVSGFRGAVSYSYPLNVPAGRGGLQPDLTLSYNSDAINGILHQVQSDWVGLGWSLDVPQIVQGVGWCPWGDPQNGHVQLCADSSYSRYKLVIGGIGYTLMPDGNGGRYRTNEETFSWVQQRQGAANQLGTDWIVKTKDGTTYYFGSTTDSEQVLCDVAYSAYNQMTYRWRLHKVVDVHNNEMVFQYDEEQNDPYHCQRASYLSHIWYNKKADGSAWGTHIVLPRGSRLGSPDGVDHTDYLFFQREYLDRVQVWWESELVREYKLQYDFNGESRRLWKLIEYGKGGMASGTALPPTEFNYHVLDNTRSDWGGGKTYPYSRLASIDNGYGGRIEIDYQQTVVNDLHGYHYRVLERRTLDGLGHSGRRVYTYGPACMDATGWKCDDGNRDWGLKGYEWSNEAIYDYTKALLSQKNEAYLLQWPLTGRISRQDITDSNGIVRQQVDTTWDAPMGVAHRDAKHWSETAQHFRNSDRAHSGEVSIKSIYTNSSCVAGVATLSNSFSVQANTNYVLSGWIYREATMGAARLDLLPSGFSVNSTAQVGIWQYVSGTWNSGSNTSVQVRLVTDCNINGPAWFDDISLAPSASPSQNLLPNGSFELGAGDDARAFLVHETDVMDYSGGNNFVWIEDALPAGATAYTTNDAWTWVTIDPVPYSGSQAHRSNVASGTHQHYFDGASATMLVASGDKLYTYVYLDPNNMPREIMLQWNDGNWEHRAYWGENLIAWGTDGTNSRRYMGPLPKGGRWMRLEVEASQVGLEGRTVDGMAFVLYDGRATWDRSGKFAGVSTKTTYAYDNYGNVTIENQYGDTAVNGDERRIRRYYRNIDNETANGKWFIGLKWAENVYEGLTDNVTAIKSQTIWYYDDISYSVNNVPVEGYTHSPVTHGKVTMVGQGIWTERATPGRFILTKYAYDAWGNVTQETDPNGNTTTITYDTTYRMFPLRRCSPNIAGIGQLCSNTEYYGVGGILADYGLPGQVKRVWDANGVATANEYRYDTFGRLVKGRRPGDAGWGDTQVSSRYVYHEPLSAPVVSNPGFESNVSGPWIEHDPSNIQAYTQDSTQAYAGTKSLKIVTTGTADHWMGQYLNGWQAGQTYQIRAYVKTTASGQLCLNFSAKNGHEAQAVCRAATGAWELLIGTVTLPADATCFLLLLRTPQVGTVYVDEVYVLSLHAVSAYAKEDAAGNTLWQRQVYDGLGRVLQTQAEYNGAQATVVDQRYDARGLVVAQSVPYLANSAVDAPWYVASSATRPQTFTQYDALGRATQVTAPDNTSTRMFYQGRQTTVVDANNHQRVSIVDAYGQLVQVREYTGMYPNATLYATTHYAYDTLGNLLTVTDALNNVTTMTYDKLSRKTAMNDRDMGQWYYYYDNAGNLTQQTDARGCHTNFTYDGLNRLTRKTYSGACNGTAVAYTYDAFNSGTNYGRGYRTSMTDGSGSTAWTYDERGRVTKEIKTINGGGSFTTQYTYDSLDRVVTTTYPDGEVVRNTYNDAGQPATLRSDTYSYNYVSSASYNAPGSMAAMSYGNGLTTAYDYYDDAGEALSFRLQRMWVSNDLLDLSYQYDNVGNVKRIVDTSGTTNETLNYTYDALDRLTNVSGAYARTFAYNVIGNMMVRDAFFYTYDAPKPVSGCAAGTPNTKPHAVQSAGLLGNFSYDCNGNMTSHSTAGILSYNAENKLSAAAGPNGTFTYTYDGDGALVKKTTPDGTTYYVNASFEIYVPQGGGGTQAMAMTEPAASEPATIAEDIVPVDSPALSPTQPEKAASIEADASPISLAPDPWLTPVMQPEPTYTAGSSNTVDWRVFELIPTPPIDDTMSIQPTATLPLSTIESQARRASDAACSSGVVDSPWLTASSYTFTGLSHNTRYYYCARARSGGVTSAWSSAVYSTQDAVAPTAQMGALPSVQSQVQFAVSWSGSDNGSGVKSYDVQVQINDGSWQTWKSATTATSATYSGAYGNTYAFRVRARDQAGNVGAWSAVVTTMTLSSVKYYYFGSQRVAMRKDGTLTYLHGDHLGSASMATNASGGKIPNSDTRYYPYGEARPGLEGTALPTDRRYTGQREEVGLGLYDYNARYYDPALGRFIQADTIVPNPANPQSLNRYSYVLNSPLRYTDPSGHIPWWIRYQFMQAGMSYGSHFSVFIPGPTLGIIRPPILHGRRDVRLNRDMIQSVAVDYSDIAPIWIAAAIAEQASDVERFSGTDALEKTVLFFFPNKKGDMSRGIAQLKQSEQAGLGLTGQDLFDPAVAIQGMYAKVSAANNRINELDPTGSLAATDRYMLLALAQNSGSEPINLFFGDAKQDWKTMLGTKNWALILRYYTLHLDWLISMGWELPEGIDLDKWRETVFSDI
ncbi:MAG: DUF11 domain-containing protein [Anaerolineae bacterium]|nr:DUF11 domain-containing protein [Anaerolineae bacterium]